jgi:hypothetical protein
VVVAEILPSMSLPVKGAENPKDVEESAFFFLVLKGTVGQDSWVSLPGLLQPSHTSPITASSLFPSGCTDS